MRQAWSDLAGVLPAFLASFVEFVEALTIVLALGATRGWAAALAGAAGGLAVLGGLVAAFGPALVVTDLAWLQGAVGVLVLLFGLRWLRRAILRAAGVLRLHDEAAAYEAVRARAAGPRRAWDRVAIAGAFQAVLLEGGEVVFIVLALGTGAGRLVPAATGAVLALAIVAALGAALHRPLTRIPENALKFAVGVMLTAFGTFWTGEAAGVAWPGGERGLVLLGVLWAASALCITAAIRQRRPAAL